MQFGGWRYGLKKTAVQSVVGAPRSTGAMFEEIFANWTNSPKMQVPKRCQGLKLKVLGLFFYNR